MTFSQNCVIIKETKNITPSKGKNKMKKSYLKEYARLLVKCGIAVKKGDIVIVNAGLDQPEFVKMVVEECYRAKAARVQRNNGIL